MARVYKEEPMEKLVKMEIGDQLITKSRPLTKTDLEMNVSVNGLYHQAFCTEEGAKKSGWREPVFPGYVALNYAIGLLIQTEVPILTIGYLGIDDLKFTAPIYPGDAIRFEFVLTHKRQTKGGNYVIEYDFKVRNQDEEVCIEGHNV